MSHRPIVLHLIKGLGIGGAERLISEGSRYWDREVFDYRVGYVLPWKDQLVPVLEDRGIPVTLLGSRRGMDPATPLRFRRFARDVGFDVVHIHSPGVAGWARLVSPAPVVYTEHNLVGSYHSLTRFTNRATYFRNAASVAVSAAVADSVEAVGLSRPAVIRNGVAAWVDPTQAAAARSELRLEVGDPLVVHVGNVRPGKGHEDLIRAARIVLESEPDTTFVSLGVEKSPGTLDRLRSEAGDLGDRMRFLGRRPDAWAFIATADAFVNPSEVEGLPLAVLEAMQLGTPVVATKVGGVPDVINGDSGILVDAGDPVGLAAAIVRILGDPELGLGLADHARHRVDAEFSLERMVRAYEDLYREVLGG